MGYRYNKTELKIVNIFHYNLRSLLTMELFIKLALFNLKI